MTKIKNDLPKYTHNAKLTPNAHTQKYNWTVGTDTPPHHPDNKKKYSSKMGRARGGGRPAKKQRHIRARFAKCRSKSPYFRGGLPHFLGVLGPYKLLSQNRADLPQSGPKMTKFGGGLPHFHTELSTPKSHKLPGLTDDIKIQNFAARGPIPDLMHKNDVPGKRPHKCTHPTRPPSTP